MYIIKMFTAPWFTTVKISDACRCSTNKLENEHLYYAVIKNGDMDSKWPKQFWQIDN